MDEEGRRIIENAAEDLMKHYLGPKAPACRPELRSRLERRLQEAVEQTLPLGDQEDE